MNADIEPIAATPGLLFHHQELGRSGCIRCGWSGVPVPDRPDECPRCQLAPETDEVWRDRLDLGPRRVVKEPGRNDPCTCGSGRKYKKCCGR